MDWIDINDRPPPSDERVLVACGDDWPIHISSFYEIKWDLKGPCIVTHWMPLPYPPRKKNAA